MKVLMQKEYLSFAGFGHPPYFQQPNNFNNEDCIRVRDKFKNQDGIDEKQDRFYWEDLSCHLLCPYICEKGKLKRSILCGIYTGLVMSPTYKLHKEIN